MSYKYLQRGEVAYKVTYVFQSEDGNINQELSFHISALPTRRGTLYRYECVDTIMTQTSATEDYLLLFANYCVCINSGQFKQHQFKIQKL